MYSINYILIFLALCLVWITSIFPAFASGDEGTFPNIENVAISPNGTKIAFISDLDNSSSFWFGGRRHSSTLWISNRDGSDGRPLFVPSNDTYYESPDWSPDGTSIAYVKDGDIFISGEQGRNPRELTKESESNTNPRFSPDGKSILFLSNRTGKRELWHMDIQGKNQTALGLQHLIVNDPAFSPDGKSVVYSGCVRPPAEVPCPMESVTFISRLLE